MGPLHGFPYAVKGSSAVDERARVKRAPNAVGHYRRRKIFVAS
jgi:hypothetical protein